MTRTKKLDSESEDEDDLVSSKLKPSSPQNKLKEPISSFNNKAANALEELKSKRIHLN